MSGPPPPAAAAAVDEKEKEDARLRSDSDAKASSTSSNSSETANNHDLDMSPAQEDQLEALARRMSHPVAKDDADLDNRLSRIMSHVSGRSHAVDEGGQPLNPFLDWEKDPELNPHEKTFKLRKWLKTLLAISSRDPERYPKRTAGVSFRNMNVYGYGSAADYQADVGNTPLKGFNMVKSLFGGGDKTRIDILRNFEGLVKSGEMLIVLGRPGR